MYKYIITYCLNSDDEAFYQKRLNALKDYVGEHNVEKTTSTLFFVSNLLCEDLCKSLISECEFIEKDSLLVIQTSKGCIQDICRIENKTIIQDIPLYSTFFV